MSNKNDPPQVAFTCRELSLRMGGSWSTRRIRRWLVSKQLGGMRGGRYMVTLDEIMEVDPRIGRALAARLAERNGGATSNRMDKLERDVRVLREHIYKLRERLANRRRKKRNAQAPKEPE